MSPFFSYYGAKYTASRYLGAPRRDVLIEAGLGSIWFDRLSTKGSIIAGASSGITVLKTIKAGGKITVGLGIWAGDGILSGDLIEAGLYIFAGNFMEADNSIKAGGRISVGVATQKNDPYVDFSVAPRQKITYTLTCGAAGRRPANPNERKKEWNFLADL